MDVYKVVLASKKEVLMRQIKIKDQELAAKAAGRVSDDNKLAMAMAMQKELLKMLLVQVDGKPLTGVQKEDLDSLFSYQDYMQLTGVMAKITDVGDMGNEPTIEIMSSGSI